MAPVDEKDKKKRNAVARQQRGVIDLKLKAEQEGQSTKQKPTTCGRCQPAERPLGQ